MLATALVLGAALAGSLWGDDDNWPVGPFRMYATTTALDGTVTIPSFAAETADGRVLRLDADDFGLRRAEILGQLRRLREHPELLGALATAHARLHPDAPGLRSLRLIAVVHRLRGGRAIGLGHETVATWRRASVSRS